MVTPFGIYAVLVLLALFIVFYRIEKTNHEKNIKSIPIRIWVNGSRGKSSVTRLIAAGLRTDGKKVIAKTTGTSPSFILDNNLEQPVIRLGMPNIGEQIRIFKKAAKENPGAIVLECMALRPDLQWTESIQIVKPTAYVITNVRPDHLDIMGPTTKDIAKIFINAIPRKCRVFTTESNIFTDFLKKTHRKNIQFSTSKANIVSDNAIKKFSYIEHKENVALALDVCKYFGVDEKIALRGMQSVTPDPGALQKYEIKLKGKCITLLYAMAANDPESTLRIWQSIDKNYPGINILANCRDDRVERSFQLATFIKNHVQHAEHYILTGSGTDVLAGKLSKIINKQQILNLGNEKPKQVLAEVAKAVSDKSLIFAIGNTVGYGTELIREFLKQRGE